MRIQSSSFSDGMAIPGEFAFAVIDSKSHVAPSRNRNPHLSWDEAPEGTASFALFCHDPDVPSRADDVNREDREVPASLPRIRFITGSSLTFPLRHDRSKPVGTATALYEGASPVPTLLAGCVTASIATRHGSRMMRTCMATIMAMTVLLRPGTIR